MSHARELRDQDVEELAEELWTLGEEGRDELGDVLGNSRAEDARATLELLVRRGLAELEAGRVRLTAEGRTLAERQVRRHRLAEALLAAALQVDDDVSVNRTACVMEHVLDAATTDSVCAFLGHPPVCPHGKPIPPGPCCRSLSNAVEPLVQPLSTLPVGASGRIVLIAARDRERLVRLSGLGVVPGAVVYLEQRSPAAVLRVGETTLATEPELAAEIYVKRVPPEA
jgi:DtxR family transcriptional regulator, Mn-dependent transcriptional regulator